MAKVLVCYYSRTGNTEKMAKKIADVIRDNGVLVDLKRVEETKVDDLLNYDGIVFGSPTYYGSMAWQVKKLLDESVKYHGKLKGKIGGAFSSAGCIGGGNETTILSMLHALIVHGMIIQGEPQDDHYGPVAIKAPDSRSLKCCELMALNVANLVKKMASCMP